jgi:hypothetical protein
MSMTPDPLPLLLAYLKAEETYKASTADDELALEAACEEAIHALWKLSSAEVQAQQQELNDLWQLLGRAMAALEPHMAIVPGTRALNAAAQVGHAISEANARRQAQYPTFAGSFDDGGPA